MQAIYTKNAGDLEGHPPFGNGECVALPQAVTNVGHTIHWYPGSRVVDLSYLNEGSVIANFVFKRSRGRFPNKHGYHAAIFVGFAARNMTTGERSGIYVMDQWVGRSVRQRMIRAYTEAEAKRYHIEPADNANEFYVVQN